MCQLLELMISGTKFSLELSSEEKETSLWSLSYVSKGGGESPDTEVKLSNFSGTLFISKSSSSDNDSTSTEGKQQVPTSLNPYITSVKPKITDKEEIFKERVRKQLDSNSHPSRPKRPKPDPQSKDEERVTFLNAKESDEENIEESKGKRKEESKEENDTNIGLMRKNTSSSSETVQIPSKRSYNSKVSEESKDLTSDTTYDSRGAQSFGVEGSDITADSKGTQLTLSSAKTISTSAPSKVLSSSSKTISVPIRRNFLPLGSTSLDFSDDDKSGSFSENGKNVNFSAGKSLKSETSMTDSDLRKIMELAKSHNNNMDRTNEKAKEKENYNVLTKSTVTRMDGHDIRQRWLRSKDKKPSLVDVTNDDDSYFRTSDLTNDEGHSFLKSIKPATRRVSFGPTSNFGNDEEQNVNASKINLVISQKPGKSSATSEVTVSDFYSSDDHNSGVKNMANTAHKRIRRRVSFAPLSALRKTSVKFKSNRDMKTRDDNHVSYHSMEDIDSVESSFIAGLERKGRSKNFFRKSTQLHYLCTKTNANIDKLKFLLKSKPEFASTQDVQGRLPLHLIGQNEELLFGHKKKEVSMFIKELTAAYPAGITTLDNQNLIPFTHSIASWIKDMHNTGIDNPLCSEPASYFIPQEVYVTPIVCWSLEKLSSSIQIEDDYNIFLLNDDNASFASATTTAERNDQITDHVSSIQLLLKTVLLIDNESTMQNILNMRLFNLCLFNIRFVDTWLVAMLESDHGRSRAIDFFHTLSNLTVNNVLEIQGKPRIADYELFYHMREVMIQHIAGFEGLLPALFVLNPDELARICSTYAIQRILEISIINQSLIGLMVFDFSMHFLLLLAYNINVVILLQWKQSSSTDPLDILIVTPWLTIFWICLYYFLRDEVVNFFMMTSRKKVYMRYFNFWNFIEIASITAALSTTIYSLITQTLPSAPVVAITKGLLWLRVFTFFKTVNVQLATFVLSLGKIFKTLSMFLIVLFPFCFMFADMFHHIVLSIDGLCANLDPSQNTNFYDDYCSHNFFRGFIRVYAIIVGDVELSDYRETPFMTALWFVYSMLGIVMLLNVLIALVNGAYEKSIVKQRDLLGQARIPLLARHAQIGRKVSDIMENTGECSKVTLYTILCFFLTAMEISFFWMCSLMIGPLYLSFVGEQVAYLRLSLVISFVLLANIALGFTIVHLFNIPCCQFQNSNFRFILSGIEKTVKFFIYNFIGIKEHRNDDPNIETGGVIDYITKQTRTTVENVEFRIQAMLQRVHIQLDEIGLEISEIHESFS